jgi:hypothetical protein
METVAPTPLLLSTCGTLAMFADLSYRSFSSDVSTVRSFRLDFEISLTHLQLISYFDFPLPDPVCIHPQAFDCSRNGRLVSLQFFIELFPALSPHVMRSTCPYSYGLVDLLR